MEKSKFNNKRDWQRGGFLSKEIGESVRMTPSTSPSGSFGAIGIISDKEPTKRRPLTQGTQKNGQVSGYTRVPRAWQHELPGAPAARELDRNRTRRSPETFRQVRLASTC